MSMHNHMYIDGHIYHRQRLGFTEFITLFFTYLIHTFTPCKEPNSCVTIFSVMSRMMAYQVSDFFKDRNKNAICFFPKTLSPILFQTEYLAKP